MKTLLVLLLLATSAPASSIMVLSGSPPASGPTVAFVDATLSAGAGGGGTTTQTISKTLTAGHFTVIGVGWEDSTQTASVADTLGNTYTPLTRAVSSANAYAQLFYSPVTTGGSTTITVTWTDTVFATKAIAWDFTGATALDGQNTGTGTGSTAVISGTVTTTQASEALCAVVKHYDPVSVTPQGSWTEDHEDGSLAIEFQHRVVSSTGTYNSAATLSANGTWATSFGAFK